MSVNTVPSSGTIVADDPRLELGVHGRRHAGAFWKLQGIGRQATSFPRFPVLSSKLLLAWLDKAGETRSSAAQAPGVAAT